MYLKIIENSVKTYYLLCVKDSKEDIWVEHFLNEKIAQLLIRNGIKIKKL